MTLIKLISQFIYLFIYFFGSRQSTLCTMVVWFVLCFPVAVEAELGFHLDCQGTQSDILVKKRSSSGELGAHQCGQRRKDYHGVKVWGYSLCHSYILYVPKHTKYVRFGQPNITLSHIAQQCLH